jgi:PPK2 family polyphosphate:nucleotide phosphotransferase
MAYTYKVAPGAAVHLRDVNPAETHGVTHEQADLLLQTLGADLTALQEMHYAAAQNGILIVLQGLDTAGKDGTISHVMARFNPAGCRVETFKVPTPDELAHDFLWRAHRVTPPKGSIALFNRSYYEDVLVVRVHELVPPHVWKSRYTHINNFEALLVDSGTLVLKFFLYISKDEQRNRLLAREEDQDKAWKLSAADWSEHDLYDRYITAYEDALTRCSTAHAPWHIVPANHKWFRNVAIAQTIIDALQPYRARWHEELEQRGRENLAAIAAAHASAHRDS